jgi:hypothetical protein
MSCEVFSLQAHLLNTNLHALCSESIRWEDNVQACGSTLGLLCSGATASWKSKPYCGSLSLYFLEYLQASEAMADSSSCLDHLLSCQVHP